LHKALTLWRIADDNPLYELREALLNALILAGLAFFTRLLIERGLPKPEGGGRRGP